MVSILAKLFSRSGSKHWYSCWQFRFIATVPWSVCVCFIATVPWSVCVWERDWLPQCHEVWVCDIGTEVLCTHTWFNRLFPCGAASRPRLKNVDRSTAQQLAVTVGNVTVIITDFKEKTRSSSTSSSTVTSSAGSEQQNQSSSGSESTDKGSSRSSTPKGDMSAVNDESFWSCTWNCENYESGYEIHILHLPMLLAPPGKSSVDIDLLVMLPG